MIDGSPISESRWQRWFVTKDTKSFVSRLFLCSTSVKDGLKASILESLVSCFLVSRDVISPSTDVNWLLKFETICSGLESSEVFLMGFKGLKSLVLLFLMF